MNYNMMYKKFITGVFVFLMVCLDSASAKASRDTVLIGEILIIYSGELDIGAMDAVNTIVELLTYQGFQVSIASQTESLSGIENFSYVICYDLKQCTENFFKRLQDYEKSASVQNGDLSANLLFIGNQCLKDYYDYTERSGEYVEEDSTVGNLKYSFDGLSTINCMIKEDSILFLKDTSEYHNGTIEVDNIKGYFCNTIGAITHIPLSDISDELIKAAFIKEVSYWKWPYTGNPNIYAQYFVIDQVYPYQDPDKLLEIVTMLIEKEKPFVISVMPVYINGDYPSMQRFCEILRYAQANGGAIVINAPINQMVTFDKEIMLEYLTQAIEIYINSGVYPLALEVPYNWIFNVDTIEIMSHFKTIFTSEEKDTYIEQTDYTTNTIYKDGHQWVCASITLNDFGISYITSSSTAVYISMEEDITEIKNILRACEKSFVPLKSLWDMDHAFWTQKEAMTYQFNGLFLNNEKIVLTFVPTVYDKNYRYNRNMLQRFSKNLASQSSKLIILVSVTSCLFIVFILLARHVNRKNYFIMDEDDEEENQKD